MNNFIRASYFKFCLTLTFSFVFVNAFCQVERQPAIGYVYPAGISRGTTIQVTIGGQYLNNVNQVYVTGDGVSAKVVEYMRPLNNEQRQELRKQINEIRQMRANPNAVKKEIPAKAVDTTGKPDRATLPNYSIFQNLENASPQVLNCVGRDFLEPNKNQQAKEAIAERVTVEINVSPDAKPGDREIRLGTPNGITNPLCFEVGVLPEIRNDEPYKPNALTMISAELPVVVNGQLRAGDVNRINFKVHKGDNLVIRGEARKLIPYLADAVPGWFQATLTLIDSRGEEVGFADHYQFDPDPVLLYSVSTDEEYTLEVRDSIYRGREDFIYRVSIGNLPFITSMFPLGGKNNSITFSKISGWNLTSNQIKLDTKPGNDYIRETSLQQNQWMSNDVCYAIGNLPETNEFESNDSNRVAQRITLPKIINGRIGKPGDVDIFKFEGKAGEEIVAEVYARRLKSPMDSVLKITNAQGKIIATNDDTPDIEYGLLTHQSDSYIRVKLPATGVYYVQLADSENHGGDEYAYRLRVSEPIPDFTVMMTRSTINAQIGRTVPILIVANRKDGYNGDIEIVLKDTTNGFKLTGNKILAGSDSTRMTLSAPMKPLTEPIVMELEGRAKIGENAIEHKVIPRDYLMQAFAYWHLVPAQELLVGVNDTRRRILSLERVGETFVVIPAGGSSQVSYTVPLRPPLGDIVLKLMDPPQGISLQDINIIPGSVKFNLAADETVKLGLKTNLIVEAYVEQDRSKPNAKPVGNIQKVSLGVFPAIPIEVVKR